VTNGSLSTKSFSEAEERYDKKEDAGQDFPKGAFCELLHGAGIPMALHVHPNKDESAGKGHNADKAGSGGELFPDRRGREDDRDTG
jgi:hypothetical protein